MEPFPTRILVVSGAQEGSALSRTMKTICDEISRLGSVPVFVSNWHDAYAELKETIDISAILVDWDQDYVRCKDAMKKYIMPRHAQIFDHKVLVLPASQRDPFCGSKSPLMKLEAEGYNLVVPRSYPQEKIDQLQNVPSYDELLNFLEKEKLKVVPSPLNVIRSFKSINRKVLIFLYTEKLVVERLPIQVLESIQAYIWKNEETPHFVAKRIVASSYEYVEDILPPFFKALVKYVHKGKYSWHCPGHMGGVAFLRSPPGKFFFDFFGENMLAADLCNAVGELGGLLNHFGPIGDAEKYASKVFGSEYTYFVMNGTSTANKMVFQGTAVAGDVIVLDRNSHKSSMQAIMLGNYKPIYVTPVRNKYGIIGPIPFSEFNVDSLYKKAQKLPYMSLADIQNDIKLLVLTQCTYDGICYNVAKVLSKLQELDTKNMLFDEAWFPYAHFHPFYASYHSMNKSYFDKLEEDSLFHGSAYIEEDSEDEEIHRGPTPSAYKGTIFATQSTHKVLAALSQGSMVHVRNSPDPFHFDRFNTYFQANTTTSPQYSLIASLDMSSAIMDVSGESILDDVLKEVISFRCAMARVKVEFKESEEGWFFGCWQPKDILSGKKNIYDTSYWVLPPSGPDAWHGFPNIGKNQYLLDPLKVNLLTVDEEAGVEIPACVVVKFLAMNGIIMEKMGYYTMLSLFSIGSRRGKSATLVTALTQFKKLYDSNTQLKYVFTQEKNLEFGNVGLKDFCEMMNPEIKRMQEMENEVYSGKLPEVACIPFKASCALVDNNVEWVPVEQLTGRTSALLVVNYPPGIPTVMPGEVFDKIHTDLMVALAHFGEKWPGYEFEVHGLVCKNGKYYIPCLKQ
ncbi:orn arg lys decarboxylase putative [Entamoeba histolytica]|uniref:Orn arg lys decarboxylase putative n=2 Tax=Entamoeba TaxID=5758 RepID=A0A175JIX7_ENTHI|nr:orn arg lys decarboxylase putative [Entamoeba histolytica]